LVSDPINDKSINQPVGQSVKWEA